MRILKLHEGWLSSEPSHNALDATKGAEAVAAAIFMARNGSSKEEIREYIESEFQYNLQTTCEEIRPFYTFSEICNETVPAAIIAFLDGDSYEDVVREAVSLGGDADTLAAIAGSIAEAFYGIPSEVIEEAKPKISPQLYSIVEAFYARIAK